MYDRGSDKPPDLPQVSEYEEVEPPRAKAIELTSGLRHVDTLPATWDVDGILLPRPFKIVRLGPVYLFNDDLELAENFYRTRLGFTLTEEVFWQGQRCLFFRCNIEHHSLALMPTALRAILGLSTHSKCAALGLQVANYRQLRHAVTFLRDHKVRVTEMIPPELHPGIDYAVQIFDPDGHCTQLYYAMDQVGWYVRARPNGSR